MKSIKILVSLVAGAGLLASCALIPPIAIGPDALGIEGKSFDVPISEAGATGFAVQAATGTKTASGTFEDIDKPSLPIAPSSLNMDQGFKATVSVTSAGNLPDSITITDDSELEVTVSDQADTGVDPVVATIPFGPLVLEKDPACSAGTCDYTFADSDAAASALSASISGGNLSRLIQIVSEGGTNELALVLDITTESNPELNGSMELTIDVAENYIKF